MEQTIGPVENKHRSVVFLKNLYFYLVSFVALMMVVFSLADMLNTVLRMYVFTKADDNNYYYPMAACDVNVVDPSVKKASPEDCAKTQAAEEKRMENSRIANRQASLVRDISMIVVGVPLFLYHWMIVRRKEEKA